MAGKIDDGLAVAWWRHYPRSLEPQFDLLAVVEDELLMALPLVPMHETCPDMPVFSAGEAELAQPEGAAEVKPHPFAALAQLKKLT